ncbi:MAG: class I SAM-dependent methyltransferase [candidate division KSB1 bacterium]|nr:class I SAM-dependent methyltransferase [candidate division KSB1 bacterium]
MTVDKQFNNLNEAFSRQSVIYDAHEAHHPILQWMRHHVRTHVLSFLRPHDKMLELNAGTGLDAVFFANRGFKVHATDLADGMISQLKRKVDMLKLHNKITIQKCSFTDLEKIQSGPFDYIFSNFGGLNCVDDLTLVTNKMPALLSPGGFVTVVMMPPICPWELALIFRGHFKTAMRRLRRGGAQACIEGVNFISYYFSPRQVLKAFGKGFKKAKLQGLASVSPPPYMENFPKRYPTLYKFLIFVDKRISGLPPFNSWADHFILTVQYLPECKSACTHDERRCQ